MQDSQEHRSNRSSSAENSHQQIGADMSILQYPDGVSAQRLQIWNNAAFDEADVSFPAATINKPPSWLPLQPISANRPKSPDYAFGKENRSPVSALKPVPTAGLTPFAVKPLKVQFKLDADLGEEEEERSIDLEIEEVEKEIGRLMGRLEKLRCKKAERDSKTAAAVAAESRRGRVVQARFMDSKQIKKGETPLPDKRRVDETPAREKSRRRGLSLGPSEIARSIGHLQPAEMQSKETETPALDKKKVDETPGSATIRRRELSLGPSEVITGGIGLRQPVQVRTTTATTTPLRSSTTNSRQAVAAPKVIDSKKVVESPAQPKSAGFRRRRGLSLGPSEISAVTRFHQLGTDSNKLQATKEGNAAKEHRRSASISPKSRKLVSRAADMRRGIATVGAKKPVMKDGSAMKTLQPKSLFREEGEEEKALPGKTPARNRKSRIVPSRYSLVNTRPASQAPESKRRKWSLPEKEEVEEVEGVKRSCVSLPESGDNVLPSTHGRKQRDEKSPKSITYITGALPRIRTSRGIPDSPRDSGPAKRVVELIGRRTHFGELMVGRQTSTTCQNLNFDDDEEAESEEVQ